MNDEGNLTAIRAGRCPDCNVNDLVAGPWGGASRNLYCPHCLITWNAHGVNYGVVRVDRGDEITSATIEWARRVYGNERWSGV
jgi:hypothetical protein